MSSKKRKPNIPRLKSAYDAYLQWGTCEKAAQFLRPPVRASRLSKMLAQGAELGLYENPIKVKRNARIAQRRISMPKKRPGPQINTMRMIEAKALYEKLGTMALAGAAMEPPISKERVGQLLRRGAQIGLFPIPKRR